jgi:ketosteroid isomerase-like protein
MWNLERAYWEYARNNDVDGYLTLWDERFVGWPSFSKTPMGKNNISGWLASVHNNPSQIYDYELTREAVRAFGDVVVVHYRVHHFYRSADTGEIISARRTSRITHTWQKRGDSWQIITGMSCSPPADDANR